MILERKIHIRSFSTIIAPFRHKAVKSASQEHRYFKRQKAKIHSMWLDIKKIKKMHRKDNKNKELQIQKKSHSEYKCFKL